MYKRIVLALLGLCVALSLAADQNPPVFYFGGQRLYVGMSKSEAVAILSACCKLSPPADSENEKLSADTGRMLGHLIWTKDESQQKRMLGAIYFAGGKVIRIERPRDDTFDSGSDDAIALARALDRSLLQDTGDSSALVRVSTQHERMSNAESQVLLFSFPNGRVVELEIATLDTPSGLTGKRDSVGLNEALVVP